MANHIAQLKSMFPAMDEESIRSVLTHCRNDVNAAIEKLLTFSEDAQLKEVSMAQTASQASVSEVASKSADKRSHQMQQYHWMNLPPLRATKPDNPVISPSPQWVYRYPCPLYGPAHATDKSSTTSVLPAPPMKQLPRQQQASSAHCSSHQQGQHSGKKHLVVMRGLPGSGKSTLARKLKGSTGVIYSTDDYYMINGMYQFDVSRLGEYHEQNQKRAKDAMRRGISPIIIDNTNTKCHEMKPYVAAALQFNYTVEFREPDTSWKFHIPTLIRKNTHGVSKATLERMLDRYEHHVTVDMVMGTNKNSLKPVSHNRDAYSAPVRGAGGVLIPRSPPVNIAMTQRYSPQLKAKRYSHGNQTTGWHSNRSIPPGQNDKSNCLKQDVDSSQRSTFNNLRLDTVKTISSDISNDSTPLLSTTSNTRGPLSIDTNMHPSDVPVQTISSPYSNEAVQQLEECHSYPITDLNHNRINQNTSHNLHHSLSDSIILPISAHPYFNESFYTVPRSTEQSPVFKVQEATGRSPEECSNISRKWPSTELYHDSDDSNVSVSKANDSVVSTVDGQLTDSSSNVVDDTITHSLTELTDNDIDFLKSCFPSVTPDQVLTVYNECGCSIETALGRLLQLPTTPVPRLSEFSDARENEEVRKSFQEEYSGQTVDDCDEVIATEEILTTSMDEEVARALQDKLDKAFTEDHSSCSVASEPQNVSCAIDSDEGLILRLSPSLASKLQDMFGSVKEYLVNDGDPSGDDLVVLLSEKAAKEIHKKWVDTLQAKQIETRYINSVQLRKDTKLLQREGGGQVLVREDEACNGERKWKKHRSKQHKQNPLAKSNSQFSSAKPSTSPSMKDIILQQGIVEQESQQVSEIVSDACKNSIATNIKVKELYNSFPSLNQHYIDQLILEHQFNFEQVTSELQRRQARKPISVVANPSLVTKPAKMSPRKHETTNAANDRPATGLNSSKCDHLEKSLGNPSYEDIRAEAALHAKLRAESFQKAAEARSKKQGDLAVFYAQQGHLHTDKMNDANERAAEMILSCNMSSSDVIDFHGLFVKEAIEVLEETLTNTTHEVIYVVTGKGSHSSGGVAKIKPAVINYLDKKGYRYDIVNEGQIKIFIND